MSERSYAAGMDEHAKRVCSPLLGVWSEFENESASLLDLSRLAEQASDALDGASAPLPQMLRTAASELESAYYTNQQEAHLQLGRRILGPVIAQIEDL
jgi:hypothetical protein